MKIVVVSDNHGDIEVLERIYLENQDASYFFHLGDSSLPKEYLSHYLCIKGNNDFFLNEPLVRDIEYPFGKIHMEHGHHINYIVFDRYVESKNCDIFLFGHTHKKTYQKVGHTFVFNPGSTSRPRDGKQGSYLILNFEDNKFVSHEFKLLD